jgi:hypothetical protein
MTVLVIAVLVLAALNVAQAAIALGAYREYRLAAARARAAEEAALADREQSLVGRPVLVNTTGSTAVRGVVHADLPDRLTLRDATVLTVGSDAEAPAGGLLHVLRHRIDLVQEITAPAPGKADR